MKTIQVVVDTALLRATDRAAKRERVDRSTLVREALREYLKRLETRGLEARDHTGYEQHLDNAAEAADWERVAAWPEG